MTNELSKERAIEALYTVRAYYASLTAGYPKGKDCKGIGDVMCSEIANSCLMAIQALEQQPCEDTEVIKVSKGAVKSRQGRFVIYDVEWLKENFYSTEEKIYGQPKQPCEDCISRQAAIDAITKIHPIDTEYDCTLYDKLDVMYALKDLPPVTPQIEPVHIYINDIIPSYSYATPKDSLNEIKEYLKENGCEDFFIEQIDDNFCRGFGTAKECIFDWFKRKYWDAVKLQRECSAEMSGGGEG